MMQPLVPPSIQLSRPSFKPRAASTGGVLRDPGGLSIHFRPELQQNVDVNPGLDPKLTPAPYCVMPLGGSCGMDTGELARPGGLVPLLPHVQARKALEVAYSPLVERRCRSAVKRMGSGDRVRNESSRLRLTARELVNS